MEKEQFTKYQNIFMDLWNKVKTDDLAAMFSIDLADCIYDLVIGDYKTDQYWTDAASRICLLARQYKSDKRPGGYGETKGVSRADEWARTILWWADSVAQERYQKEAS